MSITLTVLFNTFNQSLLHSAQLFEQNRLIWMAESLLEKIKFSSFTEISHCLTWKQSAHSKNKKDHQDYCYYVIDQNDHHIDSKPDHTKKFFSFLVEVTPISFTPTSLNQAIHSSFIEKKNLFNVLKIHLQIEHQQQKITLIGFKWVKNNASF